MRKVILFIATSLDGYIARTDGETDWLFGDCDYGYTEFLASIDTTLSGGVTYRQVLTFGEFPYPHKVNYVFTKHPPKEDGNPVTFVPDDPAGFTRTLKQQTGKDIWLVGGGQINTLLLNAGLIDEMVISVHPVLLGEGVPLFRNTPRERWFDLTSNKSYESGLLQLTYRKKSQYI